MNNLEPRARKWLRVRIVILGMLMGCGAVLVVARAHKVQIRESAELKEMAKNQQSRAFRVAPRRGTIFDREGAELAVSVDVDSVFANPRQLRANGGNVELLAKKLSKSLRVDRATIVRRLASDRYFVWIKRKVTPQQAESVRQMNVLGLELTKEARRFYPNRHLASHLIGYSNVDGQGIEGLELSLNDRLRGADQRVPALRDRRGKVVFLSGFSMNALRKETISPSRSTRSFNISLNVSSRWPCEPLKRVLVAWWLPIRIRVRFWPLRTTRVSIRMSPALSTPQHAEIER